MLEACMNNAIVLDGAPAELQKNKMAAMFRNGLAVLAFSIAEAFVRDRTAEVLKGLSNISVRFSDLSEKLQMAATINALKAIIFRASLREKTDQISWALGQLPIISASVGNPSTLSAYSFAQSKSNISHEDISDILGAFGVEGGWTAISHTAKRIGLGGIPDYSTAFKDLAKRRHAAAHDATTNIPINDLKESAVAITAICCSFDLLLSHALSTHNTGSVPNRTNGLVTAPHIGLRFISLHPKKSGSYREQIEVGGTLHTVRVHSSLQAAETASLNACTTKRQQLVHLGANLTPERWRTW